MFEKSVSKLCVLLFFTLLLGGCQGMGTGLTKIICSVTHPDGQIVRVKSDLKSVDVRQDPSTNNPPILTLPGGMEVLKICENSDWVQVSLDMDDGSKMDGWINKDKVVTSNVVPSPPQSPVDPNSPPQVQTVKVKSSVKSVVNVRRGPSMKNRVILTLPGGMEVMKISENADWVQVRLEMDDGSKVDGWISKQYVE